MKSLFKLLKEPKFVLYFIVGIVFSFHQIFYGIRIIGIIFLTLIIAALIVNLVKTQ